MGELADLLKRLERAGLRPRSEALYKVALTHASFVNEQPESVEDNERLEFLGDAVLDFLVSEELYSGRPDLAEGSLTRLRATIVCEPSLAACASDLGLDRVVRLGRGEEATGGRSKASILAGCMEAVTAAVYLDCGLDGARAFVREFVIAPSARDMEAAPDSKTALQETLQARCPCVQISYRVTACEGPDHDRTYTVEVVVDGRRAGLGRGRSKRAAEQDAARDALTTLG